MATPNAAEHRDLEQRFRNLERALSDTVSATLRRQPMRTASTQVDVNSMTSTADGVWTQQAYTDIAVPTGYSRATVQLFAATGATFTGVGNAGIQPLVSTAGAVTVGNAVSSGTPGAAPLSVSSNGNFSLTTLGPVVKVGVMIQRSGAIAAGSQNWHLSALVWFLR